ncbi:TPA: ribbon-helix-helix protein, CopG family [Candidatus Galligastranaerophilus faecipullorum]|nr:ribbon-helix-helix protein, CopG family [Candidatus Galligastranaerophilus faecipullorum]
MARILVSMPDDFLKSVDKLADNERRTRSELVREALRSYIRKTNSLNSKKALENAKTLDKLLD